MTQEEKENRISSFALNFLQRQQMTPNVYADQILRAFKEGYHQAEEDIRKSLVKFFADNITHGCDMGLVINIPNYTELINRCSDAIGMDLMPILKMDNYKS